ncbi:M4 family metallopeptidase [Staphylococcus sp. KG4-1]|nr:M4 family metallopeptidase [Staphylococcus sp. KG4-1]
MGEDVYTPDQDGDALRSLKNLKVQSTCTWINTKKVANGGVHTKQWYTNKAAYVIYRYR